MIILNEKNTLRDERKVEINNKINEKSPIVEIFSAMINGEDTSRFGEKANKAYAHIKKLATDAYNGDGRAKNEINSITTIMIQAPLLKRLQLFKFMGNVIQVGFDEKLQYRVYKMEGKKSDLQAVQGDVRFSTSSWVNRPLETQAISGGTAINYRQLATGNTDGMGVAQEQVITDMMNKMFYVVMNSLYHGVKDATGVKHFVESSGITSSSVKDTIKKIRRFGNVGISGDYSVTSQLNEMAGFKVVAGDTAGTFSQAVMEEIRKTGLLSSFFGTSVVEIPNSYNLTKLNATGDDFETYLPEGLMFIMPNGEVSPLQVGLRGGLQSATGFDVVTGLTK